jgi:hypothetical protein
MLKVAIDISGTFTGEPNTVLAYGLIVPDNEGLLILTEDDGVPIDFSTEKYNYLNGEFIVKPSISGIDLQARKRALDEVAKYVFTEFTETHRNQFSADISALSAGYLLGGNRLLTWIRTEQSNGVNFTTSGFRTKSYGTEARQQVILSLLNV